MHADAHHVLSFWFHHPGQPEWEIMRQAWWDKDPEFDEACRAAARDLHGRGMAGRFDHWADTPEGALALVILFD